MPFKNFQKVFNFLFFISITFLYSQISVNSLFLIKNRKLINSQSNLQLIQEDSNTKNKTTNTTSNDTNSNKLTLDNAFKILKVIYQENKALQTDVQSIKEENQKITSEDRDLKYNVSSLKDSISNLNEKIADDEKDTKEIISGMDKLNSTLTGIKSSMNKYGHSLNVKLNKISNQLKSRISIETKSQLISIEAKIEENEESLNKLKKKLRSSFGFYGSSSENDPCANYDNCGSCAENEKCIWCNLSGKCLSGDDKGPFNGECSIFSRSTCDSNLRCNEYSNCQKCINDVACGWCSDSNGCVEKDNKGCIDANFIYTWSNNNICPHFETENESAPLESEVPIPIQVNMERLKTKKKQLEDRLEKLKQIKKKAEMILFNLEG